MLTKYGDCSVVKRFISQLQLPTDVLIRDGNGRLTLPDSVPEGYLIKPLTAKDLHGLENIIIERNSSLASKGKGRNVVDAQGRLMPDVPFPELVGGRDIFSNGIKDIFHSPEKARENYRNYHTGMNYLVKKYGSQRVNETLTELRASWGSDMSCPPLKLAPTRNENGQEQLEDLPQDDIPMLEFNLNKDRLQEFENLIIENGQWQDNQVLKVVGAVIKTGQAAISLSQAIAAKNPDIQKTAKKALSFANSIIDVYELGSGTSADKTISPPVILGKEEKLVYYADEENIGRENFENFYNAVKYLVNRYGITSIPVDTLKELNALCDGHVPFVVDTQDRLQLADSVPNGHRGKPFTTKQLTHLENRITGQEGRENTKLALKITETAVATAGAIAACGAGLTIPVAVSLAKVAYANVQLAREIFQD